MKAFTGLLGTLLLGAILAEETSVFVPCLESIGSHNCWIERGDRNFAAGLYNKLRYSREYYKADKSFVISPLGVSALLGTLLFAVGPTSSSEIDNLLYPEHGNSSGFAPPPQMLPLQKSKLTMATVAMVHQGLDVDPEFVRQARELDAYVYRTRFIHSDVDGLNEFVKRKTNEKGELALKGILNELKPSTRLLFYNRLILSARLEQSFLSLRQEFGEHLLLAPRAEALHALLPELQARVLGLRLNNTNAFLLILLPDGGAKLSDVELKLSKVDVRKLPRKLNTTLVNITLPRISEVKHLYLRKVLQRGGIRTVFDKSGTDQTAFGKKVPLDNVLAYSRFVLSDEGINWDTSNLPRKWGSVTTEPDSESQLPGIPLEFNAVKPIIYAVVDARHVYIMGRYFPRI